MESGDDMDLWFSSIRNNVFHVIILISFAKLRQLEWNFQASGEELDVIVNAPCRVQLRE